MRRRRIDVADGAVQYRPCGVGSGRSSAQPRSVFDDGDPCGADDGAAGEDIATAAHGHLWTPTGNAPVGQRGEEETVGDPTLAACVGDVSACGEEEPHLSRTRGQPRLRPRRGPEPSGGTSGTNRSNEADSDQGERVDGLGPSDLIDFSFPPHASRAPVLRPHRRPARRRGAGERDAAAQPADACSPGRLQAEGPLGGVRHLGGGPAQHRCDEAEAEAGGGASAASGGFARNDDCARGGQEDQAPRGARASDGELALAVDRLYPTKRRRIRGKQTVLHPGASEGLDGVLPLEPAGSRPADLSHRRAGPADGIGSLGASPQNSSGDVTRTGPSRLSLDLQLVQCGAGASNRDGRDLPARHGARGTAWAEWRGRPPDAAG